MAGGGALICAFSLLAIGFASWIVTPQNYPEASFGADDVNLTIKGCDYVTEANIAGFNYYPGYGFLEDQEYKSSISLKGDMTFDVALMEKQIETFASAYPDSDGNTARRFSLEVNVAMDGYSFSISNLSISSSTYVKSQSSESNNVNIETVGLDDSISTFKMNFSFKLIYTGSSEFPDINSDLMVKLTPGEYAL